MVQRNPGRKYPAAPTGAAGVSLPAESTTPTRWLKSALPPEATDTVLPRSEAMGQEETHAPQQERFGKSPTNHPMALRCRIRAPSTTSETIIAPSFLAATIRATGIPFRDPNVGALNLKSVTCGA